MGVENLSPDRTFIRTRERKPSTLLQRLATGKFSQVLHIAFLHSTKQDGLLAASKSGKMVEMREVCCYDIFGRVCF